MHHINTLTKIDVKIDKRELPTFYRLPKLHKRFISNSSHCSTTILSKHITSALTAVKEHVIKYSETTFSISNVNYFWSIKNSAEVIEKLRLRNFRGSQVSSFHFYTFIYLIAILSKQKCCLLSTGVSTESPKRTSVLKLRQGFLATRNMIRINVGLWRSYVKFLLSSWKTYMCNLMAWYINK